MMALITFIRVIMAIKVKKFTLMTMMVLITIHHGHQDQIKNPLVSAPVDFQSDMVRDELESET